jgi:hypothetical protein
MSIDKIAAALEIPSHDLFAGEPAEKREKKKLKTRDYLQQMPADVKKEIISRLMLDLKKNIDTSFNPQKYR